MQKLLYSLIISSNIKNIDTPSIFVYKKRYPEVKKSTYEIPLSFYFYLTPLKLLVLILLSPTSKVQQKASGEIATGFKLSKS